MTDPALLSTLVDLLPNLLAEIGDDGHLLRQRRLPGTEANLFDRLTETAEIQKSILELLAPNSAIVGPLQFKAAPNLFYEAQIGRIAPGRLLLVFTDITDRTEEAGALKKSQDRLLFAAEAMGVGLWSWDATTGVIEWDQQLCRLFERETGPKDYEEYMSCVHPEDRARLHASIETAGRTGIYEDVEHRVLLPGGRIRWIYAKAKVVTVENGRVRCMMGGALDVSSRKALEDHLRQAQKLEAVSQLTSGIAHNFNNILTGILPCAQLIAMEAPDSLLPMARDIEHSARRAAELVRHLMTFTRQRLPQQQSPTRLSETIRSIVEICRNTFPSDLRIVESYPSHEPLVSAAAGQIEQVLLNLLLNARDALVGTRDPRIEVILEVIGPEHPELRAHPARLHQDYVRLRVCDSGHGMEETVRHRIFEPFFTTKAPGQATGLGLAVSYAIIEDHHGYLSCVSEPNKGATFSIYLPTLNRRPHDQPEGLSPGTGERILVVDDEELVRRVISAMLTSAGYRVFTAMDGKDALDQLDRMEPVDLVLLDLSMPRLSGGATLPHLRKRGMKIALLSGHQASELERSDVAAVLEKPVDRQTLLQTVRQVLNPSRP